MTLLKLECVSQGTAWKVGPGYAFELDFALIGNSLPFYAEDGTPYTEGPYIVGDYASGHYPFPGDRWVAARKDTGKLTEVNDLYVDMTLQEFLTSPYATKTSEDVMYKYATDAREPWRLILREDGTWGTESGVRVYFLRHCVAYSDIIACNPAPLAIRTEPTVRLCIEVNGEGKVIIEGEGAVEDTLINCVSFPVDVTVLTPMQHLIDNGVIIVGGEQPNNYI